MSILKKLLNEKVLVFDGSKGAMLQKMGLEPGSCPELWNLQNPDKIKEIYQSYIAAGSDIIQTNTFGSNRAILDKFNLGNKVAEINSAGVNLAKEAVGDSALIAASIGPTGKLMEPSGDMTFQEAYDIFKEQVIAVSQAGADIINFETFTDLLEIKAAILAAKEASNLPIIASMSFEPNGYTMMGNTPACCAITCQSLGVDMLGVNCSTGPAEMTKTVKELNKFSNLRICAKPNAGIPEFINGTAVYSQTPENFKAYVKEFVDNGSSLIGGCCGTFPEHISAIRQEVDKINGFVINNSISRAAYICSSSKYADIEKINKAKIAKLIDNNNSHEFSSSVIDAITDRVMDITSEDYEIIYVSLDSISMQDKLAPAVKTVQTYIRLPLIIHSNSPECLEKALRIYNGRAGIFVDSLNDSTFEIISIASKYGCAVINKNQAPLL